MSESVTPLPTVGLQPGERAPDLVLPDAAGTPVRWYAQAGGVPAVLITAQEADGPVLAELAAALGQPEGVTVHVVAPPAVATSQLSLPVLQDAEGRAVQAYRTQGQSLVFLLDPNLRVREVHPLSDGAGLARTIAQFATRLTQSQPKARQITHHAPVLIVPEVLSASQCAQLMDVWEQEGNDATGVETSTDGGRGERLQTKAKRRRDHVVTDPARTQELAQTIGRRVMPELRKAFAYRATRFEGFKIACYESADRGFFSAHRDNLSPTTAHRRFALTLNLNQDFEGGQLRFPEYGPDLYRPDPGAALLFSCSHLHEVLDVTEGRRFVLLSFLFADEPRRAA
ncbi:MAG: 2OG-Fe(II) oxygenase [Euzebya sp.]